MTRQKKLRLSGTITAPLCKGSCRRKPTEGLFLQPFHHFVVPLPLHRGGEFRTPLGEACKRASHTRKSLSHKRGLIKINPRRRCTFSLRSSLFSLISKKPRRRQILIRMFLSIHLNLPIESANKNTQNSEMNSACFCLHFSSLKNSRKNGIINSERIISTEDLPCHTTKKRGMRFRHIMKRMILPEISLPSTTKDIHPHNCRFMPRRKSFLHSHG